MSDSGKESDANLFGGGESSFESPPTKGDHPASPQEALQTEDFIKVEEDSFKEGSHMDAHPKRDSTSLIETKDTQNKEIYVQEGDKQAESGNLLGEFSELSPDQKPTFNDDILNKKNSQDPVRSQEIEDLMGSPSQSQDDINDDLIRDDIITERLNKGHDLDDFLKTEAKVDHDDQNLEPEGSDRDSISRDSPVSDLLGEPALKEDSTLARPSSQIHEPSSAAESFPPVNSPSNPSFFREQNPPSETFPQAQPDAPSTEIPSFQRVEEEIAPLKEEDDLLSEPKSPADTFTLEEAASFPKDDADSSKSLEEPVSSDLISELDPCPVQESAELQELPPVREDTPPLLQSVATTKPRMEFVASSPSKGEDFEGRKTSTSGISSLIDKSNQVDKIHKEESSMAESVKRSFAVLNPVMNLVYWRDLKKSGVVFGSIMLILLSLAYLSLISVVAYTSLAVLAGTITFRIYKNIMQAIQKSQYGHPFKEYLELDTNLSSEKAHELTDVVVTQLNCAVSELKRLFLVEDLIDSVKFGFLLSCLTYVGAWFNGLTLIILMFVALFTLPKVYEQNQAQIDQYVGLVRTQVNDVMAKVKAAIPIGNKEKAQ